MQRQVIADNSPLRVPPSGLSRKQMMCLDGIRYSAEFADIAYTRLVETLDSLDVVARKPTSRAIANVMMDAWTIVDATHRLHDLVKNLPGLTKAPWLKVFCQRVKEAIILRDCVQHQLGEIDTLIATGGQIWGFVSWAVVKDGRHTGVWQMVSAGAAYAGDKWLFAGPAKPPFPVPLRHIRLNAFGKQLYLGRTVEAVVSCVRELEQVLNDGTLRPIGDAEASRGFPDYSGAAVIEMLVSADYPVTGTGRPR
jgi:hypothetical protein